MTENRQNIDADPSLHKLPPQNRDAEESIISAILLDNSTLLEITDVLSAEDFYLSAHQKIYQAITELFTRSEPVDLVTLTNLLREKNELESIGGAACLARLIESAPVAVNAVHYARIIHEKSVLRRLISNANRIINRCFDDRGNVDAVVDYAETAIFEIAERKTRKAFHPISELVFHNIETLEERQNNKTLLTGIPTGYTLLDRLTSGLQGSDLIILAARPAMGKTAFALNIARNAAVDANTPVALFSLEMSKEQLSMRLLTSEARVNSSHLRTGFFGNEDWVRIQRAAGILEQAPIYIDDSPDISVMDIRAKSRRLKMDKGLGLIVIDYIQLMRTNNRNERRDLEISEISRSLKILAKELNVPVLALSQLNRMLEQRSDKRPMLSDLRESGALEQDADLVAFIYRDEVYNRNEDNPNRGKAEIILAKQRSGPTGICPLAFLAQYTRFENLAVERVHDMQ